MDIKLIKKPTFSEKLEVFHNAIDYLFDEKTARGDEFAKAITDDDYIEVFEELCKNENLDKKLLFVMRKFLALKKTIIEKAN